MIRRHGVHRIITIMFILSMNLQIIQIGSLNTPHINNNPTTEMIPQTIEEVNSLFNELNQIPTQKEAEFKQNLANRFSGFTANLGQNPDTEIKYYFSTPQSYIGFSMSKIFFKQVQQDNSSISFSISFPNSNDVIPNASKSSSLTNYFINDKSYTNIHNFEEIWYYELYENIDLRYYMADEGLKYEFIVNPNGNPDIINIEVSDQIFLNIHDNEVQYFGLSNIPVFSDTNLWVIQNDKILDNVKFVSKSPDDRIYGFEIANYDPQEKLIIDPLFLGFSTYIGGSSGDSAQSIAIDALGNIYITGITKSIDFYTINAYNDTGDSFRYGDIFILKLNAMGNGLIYSTYIGGNSRDIGNSIAIDTSGNVYITGYTGSANFPTINAYEYTGDGMGIWDAFVLKLNATGNGLIYSTYIRGSSDEFGNSIVIDSIGNAYITGYTWSTDFPTINAYDDTGDGTSSNPDIFVLKLNATGNGLIYSTYIGGSSGEFGKSIAIDTLGNAYVTGETMSTDFPTINAYDDTGSDSNTIDAFVLKLNATGNGLIYSTYISGSSDESGKSIAIDVLGNAYITGETYSTDFPTINAYDDTGDGTNTRDVFVLKLNATGNGLIYSTYIGGSHIDGGEAIAIDVTGNVYLTGYTWSTDFPTINAYDDTRGTISDIFILKLNATGNGLIYSTYIGGKSFELGYAIAIDTSGNIYVTGDTDSTDFPTINAYDDKKNIGSDIFVLKLNNDTDISIPILNSPSDISYIEGSTGNTVTWTVGDKYPGVFNVTKDRILYVSDTNWVNGSISIDVDGLSVGTHSLVITVLDRVGNLSIDEVLVTVSTPSVSSSPNDTENENLTTTKLIFYNTSLLIIIFIPVLYYKRRRNV